MEKTIQVLEQNAPSENNRLQQAVECYYRRRSRKEHPTGFFFKGRRWAPHEEEKCGCCETISAPSGRFPFSLLHHCRSSIHIAQLYEVDHSELIKAIRKHRIENSHIL